jgi:hypothetical protein
MNGGNKMGFGTISLERLQCARRDSVGPTEKRRRKRRRRRRIPRIDIYFLSSLPLDDPEIWIWQGRYFLIAIQLHTVLEEPQLPSQ